MTVRLRNAESGDEDDEEGRATVLQRRRGKSHGEMNRAKGSRIGDKR